MSISQSLNNAVTGLTATSRMAEVVSSNLSNALTEGYARRVVDTSAANLGGNGAGVRVDGVRRIADQGLIGDRRLADAARAGQDRLADGMNRIESLFSPPGDPAGLGARLAALQVSLNDAAADPASDQRLQQVLTNLTNVTGALRDDARAVQTMRQEADADIMRDVETLNTSLQQVEQLNADIQRALGTNADATALMDARQRAIDKIGEIVPVREIRRPNEQVALITTAGYQLLDGPAAVFTFAPTPTITADMTIASGALSGILRDGDPIGPDDGFGRLSGGSLSAAFELRDQTLPDAQTGLDDIAADLIARFADPAVDPSLAVGAAGLLTDRGNPLDPLDTVGLAGRIAVSSAVDPDQGGALSRLRDGVGAVTPGFAGESAQLNRWSDNLDAVQGYNGAPPMTAAGRINALATSLGFARVTADEELTFASARRDTLYQAELSQGVDTDHELQKLLQIEQAYAANARLMQTINAMIQTLMEI